MTATQHSHDLVRTVDGRAVPAAGTWTIDTSHSKAEFVARHLMVTKVRGHFGEWSGSFVVGDDPADTGITVILQAASVDTGDEQRDGHVRSGDFFDVETHPTIEFRSTRIEAGADGGVIHGDLTIKDVTKPVELEFTFHGVIDDPWGNPKAAFSAETEVDREEWGLTWNAPLETGGVLLGKRVKLELEVQAGYQPDDES